MADKKTYTIYLNGKRFTTFWGMQRGFALGVMAMAAAHYNKDHFVCKCDQTDEILEEVIPREMHVN